jgi:hypothetical protein
MVRNMIDMLLPRPMVTTDLPSGGEITLLQQPASDTRPQRDLVHLLFYVPERRGLELDTIEDVIPLQDIEVAVQLDREVSRAYLVPQSQALEMTTDENGYTRVTIPQLRGHQIVAFE